MKFTKFATVALLLLSLCAIACSDEINVPETEDTPLIADGEEARRMLFLYMVADNDLAIFAQQDLQEVLQAANKIPNDCYLLVFVDDNKNARLLRYFNNGGDCDYKTVHNFGREFASCDTTDMRVVFDWVEQNYPTKQMDLVLWSHATGWLRDDKVRSAQQYSFGYDISQGDNSDCSRMYIEELAEFLKKTAVKPDRLMFDACFMQCAEVAYAMRNSANWIIASPAEIPGSGAPYEALVPLFLDETASLQNIIDAYKVAYDGTKTGVVLSAVRCSAMQQLADATAVAVKNALYDVSGSDCGDVFSYLPGASFTASNSFPNFFDMNSVMQKYLTVNEYYAWRAALNDAVPYRSASAKWYSSVLDKDRDASDTGDFVQVDTSCSGISMYLPNTDSRFNEFNNSFAQLEWYSAAAWNEVE